MFCEALGSPAAHGVTQERPSASSSGGGESVVGLNWSDVREDWVVDGGFRDIVVGGTTVEDWQRVVDIVRARGWPETFSADGDGCQCRKALRRSSNSLATRQCCARFSQARNAEIQPASRGAMRSSCDDPPFGDRRAESRSPLQVIRVIGQALGRSRHAEDSGHSEVFMRYDASTDSLVRVPPPPTDQPAGSTSSGKG